MIRYELQEKLGQGGMGAVYKAKDRLTGQMVALKQVLLNAEQLVFNSRSESADARLALAREFKTLASLRHPYIISVLDYGFDSDLQPFFTMDLLEEARSVIVAGRELSVAARLDLLLQIAQALAYLHQRGIVHRDLKPGNVMVTPGGQVKVLDFGLAQDKPEKDEATSGTLAYMAPELMNGEPASFASDLYALGMIGYELFAGRHPFTVENVNQLIKDIMTRTPDVTVLEVDLALQHALMCLLERDPAKRLPNARAFIHLLKPDFQESVAIRESYLQAADFVGRESEFSILKNALEQVEQGRGSAWLVGGESGVGKSRLLDELRTHALVSGAVVLRGQAVMEGGAPYHLWREAVRYLCLQTELADHEASVLKTLIPDLATLLDRPVEDAPEVEPQAAQQRLLNVIERVFQSAPQPTVLILEDLQWAGESLSVLKRLVESDLLIVGSYRHDEAPDLPEQFPMMRAFRLDRFPSEAITDLVESMLGEVGHQPDLIDLVERETEGNVFFIVEVVRALAEEVGQLTQIGTKELPAHVFSGGMQTVLQRRLKRVPEAALPLLKLAAVAGRILDMPLLAKVNQPLSPPAGEGVLYSLDNWLAECASVAVLEIQGNEWRFSHDKLRESILEALSANETVRLHQQIAETIETTYPDSESYVTALAYHWKHAGNLPKAAQWTLRAGEQALKNGSMKNAADFLEQALALQKQISEEIKPIQHARTYRLLARTLLGLGKIEESAAIGEEGMQFVGYPVPMTGSQLMLGLTREVTQQVWHQVKNPALPQDRDLVLEALKIGRILTECYIWYGAQAKMTYSFILGLNLADQLTSDPAVTRNYSGAAYVLALNPRLMWLARYYQNKASRVSKITEEPQIKADVLYAEGLLHIHSGQFEAAKNAFAQGAWLARQMGDNQRWMNQYAQLIGVNYLLGDYDTAYSMGVEVEAMARREHNLQYLIWTLGSKSMLTMRRGDLVEALVFLEEANDFLKQAKDYLAKVFIRGQMMLVYLHLGNHEKALELAEGMSKQMFKPRFVGHAGLEGYPSFVEVYTILAQDQPELKPKAQKALTTLIKYARIFAGGRPRMNYWLAQHALLFEHKPHQAIHYLRKSITLAQQLAMPYEEALARAALVPLLTGAEAEEHHRKSEHLFAELGVKA